MSQVTKRVINHAVPTAVGRGVTAARDVRRGERAEEMMLAPEVVRQQRRIGFLDRVKTRLTSLWDIEFFGGMIGGTVAALFAKMHLPRIATVVKSITQAPFEAMTRTSLAHVLRTPAEFMNRVSMHAAEVGGSAAPWSARAAKSAASLDASARRMEANIVRGVQPLRSAVSRGIDRVSATGFGNQMQRGMNWLAEKRFNAATKRHAAAMEAVSGAFTSEGAGLLAGAWQGVKGFFGKAATLMKLAPAREVVAEVATINSALAPIAARANAAHGLTGAAKVAHLEGVMGELRTVMQAGGLADGARKQAASAIKELGRAITSAKAIHSYQSTIGGSLKSLIKTAGAAVGRAPLFSTVVGVGVLAGLGATLLKPKMEHAQAARVYNDLAQDVGGDVNSPFMRQVQAAYRKEGARSWQKAGLETVSDVATGAMMMMPEVGMGHMGVMMGAQILPGMVQTLIPENTLLNAYEALKRDEAGAMKLEPEQRLALRRELIAAMPTVAANGGVYNRLAAGMAEEMVIRGMNASQTVKLLSDEHAFTQFAAEVAKKQQAVQQSAAKSTVVTPVVAQAQPAVAQTAEARYLAAEKPALTVAAHEAQAHGALVGREKAMV